MEPSEPDAAVAATPVRRMVVDRWEGDVAVVELEDGAVLDLPRWLLPPGAREGHVVAVESGVDHDGARKVTLRIDADATRVARDEVEAIRDRLRARDPGGDIVL